MTKRPLAFGIDFLVAMLFFVGCWPSAYAQEITVTSPSSGAVYAPGSTISITAAVTGGSVVAVAAAAQDMGTSSYEAKAPYSMSLVVPAGVIGPRNLFAVGVIANNTAILSPIITVDIEPNAAPTSITLDQSLVAFGYVGQQQKIGVMATFSDGSVLDLSKSTKLSFTSGNPSVVSVDPTGLMTSLRPGNTTIHVAYGTLAATLRTVGPTSVKGDLNGDGLVTLSDLLLLETFVGSTPTGPSDARDMNGDGKIDNLDVELLLAHCGNNCPSLNVTTTNLTASAKTAQFTQSISFTASVTGNSPKGPLSFLVDGQLADSLFVGAAGQASFVSDTLSVGGHTITALYNGDSGHGPSASQPVSVTITQVPGDVNGDGVVDCLDLSLVKAAFGTKTGQAAFNAAADVNHDGVVNILDLSFVSKQIPAGTVCQ